MAYDSPDNEIQISDAEEIFIEAMFENICEHEWHYAANGRMCDKCGKIEFED